MGPTGKFPMHLKAFMGDEKWEHLISKCEDSRAHAAVVSGKWQCQSLDVLESLDGSLVL